MLSNYKTCAEIEITIEISGTHPSDGIASRILRGICSGKAKKRDFVGILLFELS